jgi:hypothetical protein
VRAFPSVGRPPNQDPPRRSESPLAPLRTERTRPKASKQIQHSSVKESLVRQYPSGLPIPVQAWEWDRGPRLPGPFFRGIVHVFELHRRSQPVFIKPCVEIDSYPACAEVGEVRLSSASLVSDNEMVIVWDEQIYKSDRYQSRPLHESNLPSLVRNSESTDWPTSGVHALTWER